MYFYQHLLLINVHFFLMPAVNIASGLVPQPSPSQDQHPEYNTLLDQSDKSSAEIASTPSPEDAAGSAVSFNQELSMELGGGSEEVILCCSSSGDASQLACIKST